LPVVDAARDDQHVFVSVVDADVVPTPEASSGVQVENEETSINRGDAFEASPESDLILEVVERMDGSVLLTDRRGGVETEDQRSKILPKRRLGLDLAVAYSLIESVSYLAQDIGAQADSGAAHGASPRLSVFHEQPAYAKATMHLVHHDTADLSMQIGHQKLPHSDVHPADDPTFGLFRHVDGVSRISADLLETALHLCLGCRVTELTAESSDAASVLRLDQSDKGTVSVTGMGGCAFRLHACLSFTKVLCDHCV
jgi:hypothetical protein